MESGLKPNRYKERSSSFEETRYLASKRVVDLLAGILFLILSLPLFMVLAVAIRLDTRGPVFFAHTRVGGGGRRFLMWKFRTMHHRVEPYATSPTTSEDPRVTRVGRILRKTGLDELPQLWNVIRGQMSLVGPRPEMPFVVEAYDDAIRQRIAIPQGITGPWQLYGNRNRRIHEEPQFDQWYSANRSLRVDFKLILDTMLFLQHELVAWIRRDPNAAASCCAKPRWSVFSAVDFSEPLGAEDGAGGLS